MSELASIIEAAQRIGIEMDADEARRWVEAIDLAGSSEDLSVDTRTGVFGHRVAMLDFSPDDLAYFRAVGEIVGIPDSDGVETALALSGSAAQSRIQTYPGDCDFFQRVNIVAETREAACRRLAEVMRAKALDAFEGETYRFIEAKFGEYPSDVVHGGEVRTKGSPIAWTAAEVQDAAIEAMTTSGEPITIEWDAVAIEPGWCKLDWVVADPVRRSVANASNMLDATWESPDGEIVPLDGYLDPYFQEVYLDSTDIPLFSKLAQHVSADALDEYVEQLEKEVAKYVASDHPNYGKAAKRMYNVFRLSGRYPEAAFVRELFDEPATVLYQVYALVRTIEEASEPGSQITVETVLAQADRLILDVVRTLEGTEEEEIVESLLALKDTVQGVGSLDRRHEAVEAAQQRLMNLINNFFYEKLTAVPEVRDYITSLA